MDGTCFDQWTRRRFGAVASGVVTVAFGLASTQPAVAATLCRANGTRCRRKSAACTKQNCLHTPFTVTASWTNASSNHDTFVFVPPTAEFDHPSPWVTASCNPGESNCGQDHYPYLCLDKDATGPGDEVLTVRKLLKGKYESWIEVADNVPAGEVTVTLRNANGETMRTWISPAGPIGLQSGWHVFSFDGRSRAVTSVDQPIAASLPSGAHDPNTNACPY